MFKQISSEVVDDVRERASEELDVLVSEYVSLSRSGQDYKGLCPFHDENTPSFNVRPSTGTWHCFGCGKGGDALSFVQNIEGEYFPWAVKFLAERYDITIRYTDGASDDGEDAQKRDRLLKMTKIAQEYFLEQLLTNPDAEDARALLSKRTLAGKDIAARFGCGYAPSDHSLLKLLRSEGFTDDEMVLASLANKSDDGRVYPYFRHRLLWTIPDTFGKPIGFGARRLREDQKAKFINTRETPIYRKSKVLYGLHDARRTISKHRHAIVVEGYTDVMAMHLAGVTNVVATCGTAFTKEHFNILRSLVGEEGEMTFGLDDDSAGQDATMKVYGEVKNGLRRLTVLPASDGMDPDDYRQQYGDAALAELVKHREPLIAAVIRGTVASMPAETMEDRRVALDAALPLLANIPDRGLRGDYARWVGRTLEIDTNEVLQRVRVAPEETAQKSQPSISHTPSEQYHFDKELLRVFAQHEGLAREYLDEVYWLCESKVSIQVCELIERALEAPHRGAWPLHVMSMANGSEERNLISSLTIKPLSFDGDRLGRYVEEVIQRMAEADRERQISQLEQQLSNASGDKRDRVFQELINLYGEK